jgi:intracellular septation protein
MNPKPSQLSPGLKLALDLGPLLMFFIAYTRPALFAPLLAPFLAPELLAGEHAGIFAATAVFIPAVLVALVIGYGLTRHVPVMPVVTAVIVVVFGGLTLLLANETFIKLKPTIVNTLFGVVLLTGLYFGKPLLAIVLDSMFELTDEGWRKLTFRWALFFFVLAALNEVVWRTQTTDVWVSFKVFGIMPITVLFALLQTPLLMRHELKRADGTASSD